VLGTVPDSQRILVTAHDAFKYFGRADGLKVQGIQGILTECEAGVQRVEELVSLLVEGRVAVVFVESSVSDRGPQGAQQGGGRPRARGRHRRAALLGRDGGEGTYEGAYLGMIDHNVTTIARALGGTVPEAGRLGRLEAQS